ncbi:MAG: efflux RND transporter permease subunit [Candidatus Aureabacteria bacterium]|nr:efflux RND transporter permease subunit [Candidatus Auribacterota bacterium]
MSSSLVGGVVFRVCFGLQKGLVSIMQSHSFYPSTFISSLAVTRPVTTLMFYSVLVIWGLISFFKIPVELLPNASFDNISIMVNVRGGMPPEEIERLITIPIEEAMSTVGELKALQSTSKEGRASVVLSFPPGTDMDIISLEVSEKFDRIKNDLPRETERPVIAKYEQNDVPIVILALHSDSATVEDLRDIADRKIKPVLQRVNGVANVEVTGGRERKIVIEVNEKEIESRGLSIEQITQSVGKNNLNVLAGDYKDRRKKWLLRAQAQYQDLEEVRNTIIFSQGISNIIRLKDVADVSYQHMESQTISRINSKPVVSLYIQKESSANTVRISDDILDTIFQLKKMLPQDVEWMIVSNQAVFIREAIKNVQSSLLLGALFAITVLFLFLRKIQPTFIISVAIPLSIIISLGLMELWGITLNIMSLSGLALGIGMLVDNAIVVMEIISKKIEAGESRKMACIHGTGSVLMAITASTATTLIVFLPIVFVNQQTKILYGGLALTVVFSLVSSLAVAVSLVPSLLAKGKEMVNTSTSGVVFNKVVGLYQNVLFWGLKNRYYLLGCVMIMLLGSGLYFSSLDKDIQGVTDEGKFIVFVELPSGSRIEMSDRVIQQVEEKLRTISEIETFSSRIEGWSSKVYVTLKPLHKRPTIQVIQDVREKVKGIGEKEEAFIYTSSGKTSGGTEILIDLYGYEYPKLLELSSFISKEMKEIGGFYDFKLRYKPGRPERIIKVDRERATLLGFTVKEIADAVHAKVRGLQATKIFQEGKEVETIIRLKENDRKTFKEVMALKLTNRFGQKISLAEMVDFKEGIAPSEIWHTNKIRMIQLSASTMEYSLASAIELTAAHLKKIKLPDDYHIEFGGDYHEMKETYQNLQYAALVMLFLVYMLLASLFESYLQPLIVMLAAPFALIGVSAALTVTTERITMGVLIGVIMLGGIVVNNAIVFIDQLNQLKEKGMRELKAIIVAGKSRLRPILMTTSTTVLGLIPLAFDKSSASDLWSPLAFTVIGGLLSSTLLILVMVPCTLVVFRDFQDMLKTYQKEKKT